MINLGPLKPRGNTLNALGEAIHGFNHIFLSFFTGGSRLSGIATAGIKAFELRRGISQFVGHHQRNHDQKQRIAHRTGRGRDLFGALVEIAAKAREMGLLTVVAGDLILPPADVDGNLSHDRPRA